MDPVRAEIVTPSVMMNDKSNAMVNVRNAKRNVRGKVRSVKRNVMDNVKRPEMIGKRL
jgi:hypothetical protein